MKKILILACNYIEGKPVEKAIVTTVYDSETGEFLDMSVKSDDPNGLDALNSEHAIPNTQYYLKCKSLKYTEILE